LFLAYCYLCRPGPNASLGSALGWLPVLALLAASSGHYDVSVACAEHGLWPTVRGADPATAVLADGFSCRTQIEAGHLGRKRIHLAQLLAGMLGENPDGRENQS
jgi:hypothetical protein